MGDVCGLLVNAAAVSRGSRGVQRYFKRVIEHLDWPGPVAYSEHGRSPAWDRTRELLHPGYRDAILWTPCQRGSLWARRHVITVHDCIGVEYTYVNTWKLPLYRLLSKAVLANAAAVVAISEATKAAILRNFEIDVNRIHVIRSGDDIVTVPAQAGVAVARPRNTEGPFMLMVANALPHKNVLAACMAFAASNAKKSGLSFHIVGALPAGAADVLQRSGLPFTCSFWMDDAELSALYASCHFLISPSLDEGHNLVVSEALAYGAKVLCSDIPAHREYYDGRVRFFDARSHDAMVAAIDTMTEKPTFERSMMGAPVPRTFAEVAREYERLFRESA